MGQNWPRNQVFCQFLQFVSLAFFEIAYNDSLQQCLTSSRGKIHEKKFRGPKLGPKLGFSLFSKVRFIRLHQFSLAFFEIAYNNRLQQCLTSYRGETHEKKFFGTKFWPKRVKIRSKISFFCHFLKYGSLAFLDIAQDCSVGQGLIFRRAKTSKAKFYSPNCGRNDSSVLFSSRVYSNLLVSSVSIVKLEQVNVTWVTILPRRIQDTFKHRMEYFCGNSQWLLSVNYFARKLHHRCLITRLQLRIFCLKQKNQPVSLTKQ